VKKNVFILKVSVDDIKRMKIFETFQYLKAYRSNSSLVHCIRKQPQVFESSAVAKFKKEVVVFLSSLLCN
jgi:hypothetical protein